MKFTVILQKEEDNWGYSVIVPSLKGCVSQGKTKEEAIENIKDAIKLYLSTDININVSSDDIVETVEI